MTTRPHNLTADQARAMQGGRLTALIVPLKQQPIWNDTSLTKGCWEYRAKSCDTVWWWTDEQLAKWLVESGETPFQPGDVLWMREMWGYHGSDDEPWPAYRASDDHFCRDDLCGHRWRSPVTMPRWASRMTAIVLDVTVLRLFDLTEEQARKCGYQDGQLDDGFGPRPFGDTGLTISSPGTWVSAHGMLQIDWSKRYPEALGDDGYGDPWCALADLDVHLCNVDQVKEAAE